MRKKQVFVTFCLSGGTLLTERKLQVSGKCVCGVRQCFISLSAKRLLTDQLKGWMTEAVDTMEKARN